MARKTKTNPRGAGRNKAPAEIVKSEREPCQLRPREHAIVAEAAKARGMSRSNLLRAGLRAIGVAIDDD